MCGFVGIIGTAEPVPEPLLTAMRDRLAHRGPDGAANWAKRYPAGSVSIGFRRLAIIDTRHVADQPMISADGAKLIIFNGEIYNYVELRAELERAGRSFRTRSDTEVLLQAYEQWGDAMVDRLNGMFAFLIWNEHRGEALIARDRFGEKPLFLGRLSDGALVVASEIKALLAHPRLISEIDTDMIGRVLRGHLMFGVEDTMFRGIKLFHAAHRMVVRTSGVICSYDRYWRPHYDRALRWRSRRHLIRQFRERLEDSVTKRLRADVRLTACLSGGLDSSALVALMAKLGKPDGVHLDGVISARFPADPTIDEGPFIDLMLARTQLTGHTVSPSANDLVRDMRRLHWHHETIIPGASMYLEWSVMRKARQLGYSVIIDGQGGDELLAGYQIYFQAYQAELYRRDGRFSRILRRDRSARAQRLGQIRDDRLKESAKRYANAERRFSAVDSLSEEALENFHEWHVRDMEKAYGGDDLPSPDEVGALRFELAVNLLRTSLPSNLFSGDRNSMAHGIECRYPFLDYELVDFCGHLPDWAYLGDGWGKKILREALPDLLPDAVRWRPDKVGFVAPQDRWMRDTGLRAWVEERVFDSALQGIPGYDRAAVEMQWRAHLRSDADYSSDLWRLASAAEILDMQRSGAWREP